MKSFLVVVTVTGGIANVEVEPANGVKVVLIDFDNLDGGEPEQVAADAAAIITELADEPEHLELPEVRELISQLTPYLGVEEG